METELQLSEMEVG